MDWIGLECNGRDDCDLVLISNHCSTDHCIKICSGAHTNRTNADFEQLLFTAER